MLSTPPRLRPGEVSWPLKRTGNGETDAGAFGQAHEIDMDGTVADRVELDLARDHAGFLAGDVEHEEGGQEGAVLEMAFQIVADDLAHSGSGRLAAIDDGRDETLLAGLVGRAFAGAGARLRR